MFKITDRTRQLAKQMAEDIQIDENGNATPIEDLLVKHLPKDSVLYIGAAELIEDRKKKPNKES